MNSANVITIVGTGALASFFAGYLSRDESRHTYELFVYGSWKQQIEAIQSNGLQIRELDGSIGLYHLKITDIIDEIPPSDIVILLVKSYQTAAKVVEIERILKNHGTCITLQNGLGNREKIAAVIGASRTVTGITYQGVRTVAPGIIAHTGWGDTLIKSDPANRHHIEYLTTCLTDTNIKTIMSPDIDMHVWKKLAINAAINPLTALLEISNGDLLVDRRLTGLMRLVVMETVAVANQFGIVLNDKNLYDELLDVCRRTATNHSSMYQDLQRGAETEIESINGEIRRLGGSHGIDVPVNRFLIEQMALKYSNRFEPGGFMHSIEKNFIDEKLATASAQVLKGRR